MPDRPSDGLITYDAKDPDTAFPPIAGLSASTPTWPAAPR
jgi:hypothetical protein